MIWVLKVILGALLLSVQQIKRYPVLVVVCIIMLTVVGAHSTAGATTPRGHVQTLPEQVRALTMQVATLRAHVARLDRACIPRATGGGVTQCLQVSVEDGAWRACLGNSAYIGVTQEDTASLMLQCLDDWRGAHPHIHP